MIIDLNGYPQIEKMSFILHERHRQGGEYSRQRAETERHVVVCATGMYFIIFLSLFLGLGLENVRYTETAIYFS